MSFKYLRKIHGEDWFSDVSVVCGFWKFKLGSDGKKKKKRHSRREKRESKTKFIHLAWRLLDT